MRLLLALHCFDPCLERWRVLAATPNKTAVEAFCQASCKELLSELEEARTHNASFVPVLEADLERLSAIFHFAEVNTGERPEVEWDER